MPLLAELHQSRTSGDPTGARFVGLMHRLGVGREILRQTLDFATAHGWVVRNPGHGHPLRPEFALTEAGREVAPACAAARREAAVVGAEASIGRKWSLPVLRVLAGAPARFAELKLALADHGVTDRALSMNLRELESRGLVERRVAPGHPPRVCYALAERARALGGAVSAL